MPFPGKKGDQGMLLLLVHLVLVETKVWRNEKRGEKGRKKGPTFLKRALHKYVQLVCHIAITQLKGRFL